MDILIWHFLSREVCLNEKSKSTGHTISTMESILNQINILQT